MTLFMTLLAQMLHLAVMLAAALLLSGLRPWLLARVAGRPAPSPLAAVHAQRRLFAKRLVRAEPVSLATAAPILALAASLGAAALTPGFTPALAFAPFGEPLVVAGLLLLASLAEALLTGADERGLADPALLLALAAAAMPGAACWVLASAALAITVTARARAAPAWPDGAGSDLAFLDLAAALRRLVLLALLVQFVLPAGPGAAGPEWWPVGLAVWGAELAALAVLLALAETLMPAFTHRRAREALAAASLLGVAAVSAALATGSPP
jgi:formate hydrogenlyase subunit 4